MNALKTCDNCGDVKCRDCQIRNGNDITKETDCDYWQPMPCPFCGGTLSETREHNRQRWRHCFSCHFEWSVNE